MIGRMVKAMVSSWKGKAALIAVCLLLAAGCAVPAAQDGQTPPANAIRQAGSADPAGHAVTGTEGASDRSASTAAAPDTPEQVPDPKPEPERFADPGAGAVFERDDGVYLYEEAAGTIVRIGDPSLSAQLAGLSPDGRKAALRYYSAAGGSLPPKAGVYDISAGLLHDIAIDNPIGEQIQFLSWTESGRLLVEAHVNPSANGYLMYDVDTGRELNAVTGLLFDVSGDGLLWEWSPHFADDVRANIQYAPAGGGEGLVLVQAEHGDEDITAAAVSRNADRIGWITERGETTFLTIAGLDLQSGEVEVTSVYPVPAGARGGKLAVTGAGEWTIAGAEAEYRLADGQWRESPRSLVMPDEEALEPSRYRQFEEAVREAFGSAGAANVQWYRVQ